MRSLWNALTTPVAVATLAVAASVGTLSLCGCGGEIEAIRINGSSTVYPISEAIAERFSHKKPGSRVTVGATGTGGGMKRFSAGEIDICDASREMKSTEAEACAAAGVDFVRFEVAFDGIAVVMNAESDWCDSLSVEQLKSIWRPDNPVNKWNELDPEWPDERIKLYGPGTDSGTFDYFTEAINGEEKACRIDFTPSENDNVLVTGVAQDKYSLGYFGYAYYEENKDRLKLLSIEQEDGSFIAPSLETVRDKSYKPLSRPLFIYVRNEVMRRPLGKEFVEFYLDQAAEVSLEVGYVPVSDDVQEENLSTFKSVVEPGA